MDFPIVTIEDGKLKGSQKSDIDGKHFYSFLGIPFAKAPVGNLRFKAPQPVEPWSEVKDVTKENNICYQRNQLLRILEGSEDCLNLHVFTKTLPSEEAKLKPVMVWIHGGAFIGGSNSTRIYGPEFLITEDIVLVSINYRVGFLGFFHLEDPSLEVHGNSGLKDQQLALKWVQKNIKNFNGDPNNVTVFGESAGSVSVHHHVLSESSKGLFHKAILQSGVALNSWSVNPGFAIEFAKFVDEAVETDKQALEVLQKLTIEKLYEYQEKFLEIKGALLAPNLEKPNNSAIITSDHSEALVSGQYNKIPILLGYCGREGLLVEANKRMRSAAGKKPAETLETVDLDKFIPGNMNLEKDDPKRLIIKKKIMNFYFQPSMATDKYLLPSDSFFIAGIIAAAKLHAKASPEPVYLYRISLETDMNFFKKMTGITEKGVCHGDDIGYLFKTTLPVPHGGIELESVKRFIKLWTNFAKFGNPTPQGNDLNVKWKPVGEKEVNFLDIDNELKALKNPEGDRMNVWKEIFELSPSTKNYL